jgi:predicted AAA+ superfamily ATPase
MYRRPHFKELVKRLKETRNFIQVLAGPRQTGKTTLIHQALESIDIPSHYASADNVPNRSKTWIEQQWEIARLRTKAAGKEKEFILALDEIQKINDWTEIVKRLWDEDGRKKTPIKVVILGSSPLLLQKGLEESLGGRFEMIYISHWPFKEMRDSFGFTFEEYVYFGGYPGSVSLTSDEDRWKNYIKDALIETTISKDILMMTRVDKPALLRQLFELGSLYSGQILSFNKMIGQLQDAGNTTTLAHYLKLLSGAGMLSGIEKYAGETVRQRTSSPKFQVMDNSLLTAQSGYLFNEYKTNPELWGRLVESSIGSYLLNVLKGTRIKVFYWRERDKEVDFVLEKGGRKVAIEVKSGSRMERLPGIDMFSSNFPRVKPLLVGQNGIPPEEFLQINPNDLFD